MKKNIKIILSICFLLVGCMHSTWAAYCDKPNIADCFNHIDYQTPLPVIGDYLSEPCKTWNSPTFNCSGTWTVAIYPKEGVIPREFLLTDICPGATPEIIPWTSEQIKNLLQNHTDQEFKDLNLQEVRLGKIPVILTIKFPKQEASGTMQVKLFCKDLLSMEDESDIIEAKFPLNHLGAGTRLILLKPKAEDTPPPE